MDDSSNSVGPRLPGSSRVTRRRQGSQLIVDGRDHVSVRAPVSRRASSMNKPVAWVVTHPRGSLCRGALRHRSPPHSARSVRSHSPLATRCAGPTPAGRFGVGLGVTSSDIPAPVKPKSRATFSHYPGTGSTTRASFACVLPSRGHNTIRARTNSRWRCLPPRRSPRRSRITNFTRRSATLPCP